MNLSVLIYLLYLLSEDHRSHRWCYDVLTYNTEMALTITIHLPTCLACIVRGAFHEIHRPAVLCSCGKVVLMNFAIGGAEIGTIFTSSLSPATTPGLKTE